VPLLARYADILQSGARNMQNYALLREVGHTREAGAAQARALEHDRGVAALGGARHGQGNAQVILCERGIRTFETYTRNTLDLNAVPVVKELSHLPVIVDPSHGTASATRWRPWRAPRSRPGRTG
jgi:3-deoxy-7-phosphoheptulonate synthase